MGVGNRIRGEEDYCWIRNGWNVTNPTNSRCVSASLWAFSEAWPTCPHSGTAASARHPWDGFLLEQGALMRFCPAQAQISFSFASLRFQGFPSPVSGTESLCLPAHMVGNAKGCVLAECLGCGKGCVSLRSCLQGVHKHKVFILLLML